MPPPDRLQALAGGSVGAAVVSCLPCLHQAPAFQPTATLLPSLQRDVGAVHDAIASYQRCLDLDPTNRHAGQNTWWW